MAQISSAATITKGCCPWESPQPPGPRRLLLGLLPASLAHLRMEVTSLPLVLLHWERTAAAVTPTVPSLDLTPQRKAVAVPALSATCALVLYVCTQGHKPKTSAGLPDTLMLRSSPNSSYVANTGKGSYASCQLRPDLEAELDGPAGSRHIPSSRFTSRGTFRHFL